MLFAPLVGLVVESLSYGAHVVYCLAVGRSGAWPRLSREFLARNPECVVCGGPATTVHHVIPFHLRPDLELVESNWLPTCNRGPGGLPCHCSVLHGGDFKAFVPHARLAAAKVRAIIEARVYLIDHNARDVIDHIERCEAHRQRAAKGEA